jgi:hypothetical protein
MTRDEMYHELESWGTRVFFWCTSCVGPVTAEEWRAHRQAHGQATAEEIETWLREVRA